MCSRVSTTEPCGYRSAYAKEPYEYKIHVALLWKEPYVYEINMYTKLISVRVCVRVCVIERVCVCVWVGVFVRVRVYV